MICSKSKRIAASRSVSMCCFALAILVARVDVRLQDPAKSSAVQTDEKSRLEVVEELSESLANDLLELSVATRDQDLDLTSAYFPSLIFGKNFPSKPLE